MTKVQRSGMGSSGAATHHAQDRLELDCICLGNGHGRSLAVVGHVELSIVSMSELAVAESAQREAGPVLYVEQHSQSGESQVQRDCQRSQWPSSL